MSSPALPVRQVSQLHAHWQENADGAPGTFNLVAVLDDGAEELVGVPQAKDIQALIPLILATNSAFVDLESGVLSVGGVSLPVRLTAGSSPQAGE